MIPKGVRIFLATEPIHMGRSFDGLSKTIDEALDADSKSKSILVVFFNRSRTRVKLIWREAGGQCLLYKRLDRGIFRLPSSISSDTKKVDVDAGELAALLEGIIVPRRRETARDVVKAARSSVLQFDESSNTHRA